MGSFVNLSNILARRAQTSSMRQGPRLAHSNGGFGITPDISGDYDTSAADQILAPYGLQEPQHINPFVMFNDQSGLGASHPKIARAIEGAMLGAQVPSGRTIGENIANVAGTVMNIPNVYRQNEAQQFLAPFSLAQPMAQLQGMQANTDLAKAHTAYFKSQADKAALTQNLPHFSNVKSARDKDGNQVLIGLNETSGKVEAVPGSGDFSYKDDKVDKNFADENDLIQASLDPTDPRHATAVGIHDQKIKDQGNLRSIGPTILMGGRESMAFNKAADLAADSEIRYNVMKKNLDNPTGQGDVQLLFNHMGMTLGAQKGARMTEAEISRAVKTRSLPEDLEGLAESTGLASYLTGNKQLPPGGFLTPNQRQEMVRLAEEMRQQQRTKVNFLAPLYNQPNIDMTKMADDAGKSDNSGLLTGPQTAPAGVRRYNPKTRKFE